MNVTAIIFAAVVVGGVGILIGFFLGVSGEKFKVEVDEREVAVTEALPGNNCGGCGYAGCSGLAAAIVKGEAPVNQCPVGGAPVAAKIGEIMGVKAEEGERKAALVVDGVAVVDKDACKACGKCVAACPKHLIELLPVSAKHIVQCSSKDKGKDVMKACSVGCIACHLCEKNCPSDAVHVVDNVAYIDQEKCTKCGLCAEKCPKKIIL